MEWWGETFVTVDPNHPKNGFEVVCGDCPICELPVVKLNKGTVTETKSEYGSYWNMDAVETEELLYPKNVVRKVEDEVPEAYKAEYLEASAVLQVSPKASAALSRRLLQRVLRDEFDIKGRNLVQEIDAFVQLKDVPSYLSDAVDAVRNVGNFAAHPLKDTSTGEIVDVEPGEAEWTLEVLESLFDFSFVQPIRLKKRKEKLNEKLQTIGKPPMKS